MQYRTASSSRLARCFTIAEDVALSSTSAHSSGLCGSSSSWRESGWKPVQCCSCVDWLIRCGKQGDILHTGCNGHPWYGLRRELLGLTAPLLRWRQVIYEYRSPHWRYGWQDDAYLASSRDGLFPCSPALAASTAAFSTGYSSLKAISLLAC